MNEPSRADLEAALVREPNNIGFVSFLYFL